MLSLPRDILTHLFCRQTFLEHQPAGSLGSGSTLWTSLRTTHPAGAQQLFVRHRLGSRKQRRRSQTPSKRGANSPPPHPPTPSTAQLPGYCPRPGRHLLWVISICMAIITAFGEKIPLSKSPAELLMPAENGRRQLRQAPVCFQ